MLVKFGLPRFTDEVSSSDVVETTARAGVWSVVDNIMHGKNKKLIPSKMAIRTDLIESCLVIVNYLLVFFRAHIFCT